MRYLSEFFILELISDIDDLAHQAASSPKNDLEEPTDGQKHAGNYKMGHLSFQGLPISIENPKGSYRRGKDQDGKEWENKIYHHYGYIRGTEGKDKDHVDCFIGPHHDSEKVFIINQNNPKDGKFDEHKLLLGFHKHVDAVEGYLKNYDSNWEKIGGIGSVHSTDIDGLKQWLKNGNTKIPFKSTT